MEKRIYWVDYAKAVGIILVVYGHVMRGIYNADIEIPKEFYDLTNSIVYSFHMPLFFFLSGVFFYRSFLKRGGVKLINSKIDTIVYPYLIWSVVQGSVEVMLSNYTNGSVTYTEVFSLLWSPRAQFWFLYALFIAFILATFVFSMISKKAVIALFLLSAFAYLYPAVIPDVPVFHLISENFVFFVSGIIFSFYFKANQISNTFFLCFLGCAFVIGQYVFHYTFELDYSDKGMASLLLALVSILFVVSLSSWASSTPNKLFVFIGASSMAIFVMHILAGSGVRVLLKSFMGIDSFTVHLLAGCCTGVFAPLLALIIINKLGIPYMFRAPVSQAIMVMFHKVFRRTR